MFPAGTTDANLWQFGRDIMNCTDLTNLMATMAVGQIATNAPVSAGRPFKIYVSLDGPNGLVSFYAVGGGVLNMTKLQMKAAIRLWMSR